MRKVKLVSMFVLLALLLSVGLGVGMAQKPPPEDVGDGGHLLVRPEDVATFGDVHVTSPEHPLKSGEATIQGWEDAHSTAIAVSSPKPGEYAAEIINSSYEFSSPQAAQAALATAFEAGAYSLETWLDGTPLLDGKLLGLLDGRSTTWRVGYWVDGDGMPHYGFVLQVGSHVASVHIIAFATTVADDLTSEPSASHEEQVREYLEALTSKMAAGMTFEQLVDTERAHAIGQRLLNHLVERLITEDGASVHPVRQSPESRLPAPRGGYIPGVRASRWIHTYSNGVSCDEWSMEEDCHHLAAWDYTYGHNSHYHGTGGDWLTCQLGGEHGCISGWTWWLQYPESRLGIPKTFCFGAIPSGSMDANNYSATVWVN